jgi:osmotically-inducible protein OsmY
MAKDEARPYLHGEKEMNLTSRTMKILNKLKTFATTLCLTAAGMVLVTASGCYSGRPHQTSSQDREDRVITSRVEAALNATDYRFPDVKVETIDRTVKLKGSVDTRDEKDQASLLAEQGGDVKEVMNHITVR